MLEVLSDITSAVFQGYAMHAGYVRTTNVGAQTSRKSAIKYFGGNTADFALKFANDLSAANFIGLTNMGIGAGRSVLVRNNFNKNNAEDKRKLKRTIGTTFLFSTATTGVGAWYLGFHPIVVLPYAGMIFGCMADYQSEMIPRRRLILGLSLCSLPFACATQAWGLAAGNICSIASSVLYDPLLGRPVRHVRRRVRRRLRQLRK